MNETRKVGTTTICVINTGFRVREMFYFIDDSVKLYLYIMYCNLGFLNAAGRYAVVPIYYIFCIAFLTDYGASIYICM